MTATWARVTDWWDGLSRAQKWVFGIILFAGVALSPLFTPPFIDTPGISFGGTWHSSPWSRSSRSA